MSVQMYQESKNIFLNMDISLIIALICFVCFGCILLRYVLREACLKILI